MNSSLDTLIVQHRYLVDKVLSKYQDVVHPANLEEMEADGLIGLWRGIRLYDPTKQKSFKNYAYQKIRYAIKDGMRERDRLARSQRNNDGEPIEVLDIDELEEDHPRLVYTDSGIRNIERREYVESLLQQVDQPIAELLTMRFWLGLTDIQIAKRKQMHRKHVARQIRRAIDQIQKIIISEEAYECLN